MVTVIRYMNSRIAVASVKTREDAQDAAKRLEESGLGLSDIVTLYTELVRKV